MAFPFDNNTHELKLGNSFDPKSKIGYHSLRYDFKPASVDTSKEAHVEISNGSQVTVAVPHVEGSSTSHTVFKGNHQPCQKECVLIIDHKTGTYTLEKLSSKITVKKSRLEGSSKAQSFIQRLTSGDKKKKKKSPVPKTSQTIHQDKKATETEHPSHSTNFVHGSEASRDMNDIVGEISDSSDSEEEKPVEVVPKSSTLHTASNDKSSYKSNFAGVLDADLKLSDTSDSDSD